VIPEEVSLVGDALLLPTTLYVVMYLLVGLAICALVILGVRLLRAIFAALRAVVQIGRAMEDIAATLKKRENMQVND